MFAGKAAQHLPRESVRSKAGIRIGICYAAPMLETELTPEESAPASPEAIARARAALAKYGGVCCWFWKDDPALETRGRVRELIRNLRVNGDRDTWLVAREIERCL